MYKPIGSLVVSRKVDSQEFHFLSNVILSQMLAVYYDIAQANFIQIIPRSNSLLLDITKVLEGKRDYLNPWIKSKTKAYI